MQATEGVCGEDAQRGSIAWQEISKGHDEGTVDSDRPLSLSPLTPTWLAGGRRAGRAEVYLTVMVAV